MRYAGGIYVPLALCPFLDPFHQEAAGSGLAFCRDKKLLLESADCRRSTLADRKAEVVKSKQRWDLGDVKAVSGRRLTGDVLSSLLSPRREQSVISPGKFPRTNLETVKKIIYQTC